MRFPPIAITALKVAAVIGLAVFIAFLPRIFDARLDPASAEFRVGQFTLVGIWFVALLGLNLLTGYSGQISLGHGAFVGLGAYVATLLSLGRPGLELYMLDPPSWMPIGDGMRPVFTIPIAALVTGAIGFVFGIPALRLGGISLALATLAVAVSFPILMKRFDEVTGGGGGLNLNLPTTPFGWDISTRHWLFYEAWGTAAVVFVAAWLLVRGRVGRAWRALRDGEIAAVSSGVDAALYKTLAFGVSSAFAGAAGALLAIEVAYVNPDTFPVSLSILLLAAAVIGGLGSLFGAIFGALLYVFLPIYAQNPPILSSDFSTQAPAVVFGAVLIAIMLLLPGGIAGLVRRLGFVGRSAWLRRPRQSQPGA
ncbi:MAG TPA: branched-chain amino acid ABC transporter permease [Gaiellaceae bacterium]|nr:branched-chain amino acid ABC transporter permease [Gaiellaceae bacterium]